MSADAPQTTAEERQWLSDNWSIGDATFRHWLAGSDRAHDIIYRLIAHVDALAAQNGALAEALRNAHLTNQRDLGETAHAEDIKAERWREHCSVCALLSGQPVDMEAERLRLALDRTNTTGKCDHCGEPIVRYGAGKGPRSRSKEAGEYCRCTTRRGCAHRTFRDCPVCAALSGQPVATEAERLREVLRFYADPGTYFAIGFFPDPPNGEFMDDFDLAYGDWTAAYLGKKPGRRARAALSGEAGERSRG